MSLENVMKVSIRSEGVLKSAFDSRKFTYRRLGFIGTIGLLSIFGIYLEYKFLSFNGISPLEWATLFLFSLLFPLLSFGAATGIFGVLQRIRGGDPVRVSKLLENSNVESNQLPPTAVIFPIYCEDVSRVFANLESMMNSCADVGLANNLDFFVLSDTSDPDIWIQEEKAFSRLSRKPEAKGRVYYRKRRVNLNKKSGNIADFCRRWGKRYRYMIVLDADSLMSGECVLNLIKLMEAIPNAGLIQTVPRIIRAKSLFQRLAQFGTWLSNPIFGAGSYYWQVFSGPFWGHNAIVRLRPFMEYCGLPGLPGSGAIGGKILSHDTIEAALIRKAGYTVWFAYDLNGSYEEYPPNLLEGLKRDNRWCQGNLQHFWFLFVDGLRISSRIHILLGILSYSSSLLWALMLLSTVITAMADMDYFRLAFVPEDWVNFKETIYLPVAYGLQIYTLGVLFLPRILFFLDGLFFRRKESGIGILAFVVSFFGEFLQSVILAPAYMIQYIRFLWTTFWNRKIEWGPQNRKPEAKVEPLALARMLLPQAFYATGISIWLFVYYPILFYWLLPITLGWVLSFPISYWASSISAGEAWRKYGLLKTPEESLSPPILEDSNKLEKEYRSVLGEADGGNGVFAAIVDPLLFRFHSSRLKIRKKESKNRIQFMDSLAEVIKKGGPSEMSEKDIFRILWDRRTLIELHSWFWEEDVKKLPIWWREKFVDYQKKIREGQIEQWFRL
ncbi:glucan biosynthesis glucosyltransferase H [Leptospira perolatii]|uniref:Glucans biosynthesis glucosyltransferase H n=1 Tax=Leptospira perolatii TaxID=2023191 RepID=A0A2M9ZK15_9LEPT|nr:glucans biosynthesis glucosyltransferase MdoH [Leptospira perolatii]PJZ69236.1 glucan biosynthesis glucosyltransferase H [Leptospira perolatii]PJZ72382.1 glucan biosynthesis glucosyltransferase H [Leptospira perolatii]